MAGLVEGFGRIQVFAQYVPDGQGVVIDLIPKNSLYIILGYIMPGAGFEPAASRYPRNKLEHCAKKTIF